VAVGPVAMGSRPEVPIDPFGTIDPYGSAGRPASLTASLLVAAPGLLDPNFGRRVVLVLDHGPHGALGLVINHPGGVQVHELLDQWAALASTPSEVFTGGPVARNAIIGLVQLGAGMGGAVEGIDTGAVPEPDGLPEGWRPLFGTASPIGTVDVGADPSPVAASILGVRLFSGYAGWDAGQLESEIDSGSWYVVPADEGDPLTDDPGGLWQRVLHRQGGVLSVLSRIPVDPSVN
jgi:putative transcriptional regulator